MSTTLRGYFIARNVPVAILIDALVSPRISMEFLALLPLSIGIWSPERPALNILLCRLSCSDSYTRRKSPLNRFAGTNVGEILCLDPPSGWQCWGRSSTSGFCPVFGWYRVRNSVTTFQFNCCLCWILWVLPSKWDRFRLKFDPLTFSFYTLFNSLLIKRPTGDHCKFWAPANIVKQVTKSLTWNAVRRLQRGRLNWHLDVSFVTSDPTQKRKA